MGGYEGMAASADKWLHQDGSVTTLAGEAVLPADAARAEEYASREPSAAKWLLPDGTVASALPFSGGAGDGGDMESVMGAVADAALRADGALAKAEEANTAAGLAGQQAQSAAEAASHAMESATGAAALAQSAKDGADGASAIAALAKQAADSATAAAADASAKSTLAKEQAEDAAAIAASALAKIPKRAFLIADITESDKHLTVGDCQVRLHRYGEYCQVYAKSLSGKVLDWSSSTLYDGGAAQNRFGSGTAEQQIEDDIGYGGAANRLGANIRIEAQGWRLEVAETGTASAATLGCLWASLELMEATA